MSLTEIRPFIGGNWHDGESTQVVTDKFSGEPVTVLHKTAREQVEAAVSGVARAQADTAWTPYDRYLVLSRASELLREQRLDVAETMINDTGFTTTDALRDIDRAVQTLLLSGEEAKRNNGEVVPIDGAPGWTGRIAFTVRYPLGVVCAITPFNSPLNTPLHKLGPAFAAGNGVVLKPASTTSQTADRLLRLLLEAGLPEGLISVVYGDGATVGEWLLEHPTPAFYAFTGSTPVGERIHRAVGLRRVQLELGSLSSTLICDDADLDRCVPQTINGAFRKAGQVCTSVQRLYVQRGVVPEVVARMTELLAGKVVGDPRQPDAFVGPLISSRDAERVSSWLQAAADRGAKVVAGGERRGNVLEPTVLTDATLDMDVMCQEIFGPVVVIRAFDVLEEAIAEVNDTPFGLAAGIFTRDIGRALVAAQGLRMGSVHINESSSNRTDLMPYTGVKQSGMGREGPRYAMREMSEERLITIGEP
jgi:succinate-semialdehyde dehydrogenase/glutarate-semialdehyde dehydrogenase